MAKKFLQFISLLAKLKTPFHSLELQTLTKVWFQQQPSQTIQKNSISKEKLYLNKTKVSLLLKTNPCSSKQPTLKKWIKIIWGQSNFWSRLDFKQVYQWMHRTRQTRWNEWIVSFRSWCCFIQKKISLDLKMWVM